MINLKINNKEITVPEGTTILDAATKNDIYIPTLCYLREINEIGSCRICVVEVKGSKNLVASCVAPVLEGMEVFTESERVIMARKNTLSLIVSNHNKDCNNCSRNRHCELQKLTDLYNIDESKYIGIKTNTERDVSTVYLDRDNSKCILCGRCAAICKKIQMVGVIGKNHRGMETAIGCAFEKQLTDVPCIACGQCTIVCPTGALVEQDDCQKVVDALNNKNLYVVVATAPSVRVALGEEFSMPIGTNVQGKMVSSLRKLGFDKVFDIDYGADLTIIEEADEFVERLNNKEKLPLITSCSPGWIKFVETYHPDLLENVSSCKSPQQMFGAMIKTYYAQKSNIDPKNICVVTVMPCIAKKFEAKREHQNASGIPDVDIVITTRELAKMIKQKNIDFTNLDDENFDNPLGYGASIIFGSSGGVMESALRTLSETLERKELQKLEFQGVRGLDGIKEAEYEICGTNIKVAAVSGIKNANTLLEKIKNGEKEYHFIEIMACPGGCINGGGQPVVPAYVRNNFDYRKARMESIYQADLDLPIRKAHNNPYIKQLYDDFLKKPGSKKAHELLHTKYQKRDKYY